MYAPDGADATHEWVEVCNAGTASVDVLNWKFYENGTNHKLILESGNSDIAPGDCFIIADNASVFASDYADFSGTLFDSVFSLKNTGETIAIKDDTGVEVDTVTYTDSDGAKDDGNSLHIQDKTIIAGTPTPGVWGGVITPGEVSNTTPALTNTTLYSYETVTVEPPQDVYIRVPAQMITTNNTFTKFSMESYDAKGLVIADGVVNWVFGDGGTAVGREVMHKFLYPGEYIVNVMLTKGALFDTQQIAVTVVPLEAELVYSQKGDWVEIQNKSAYQLTVSNWRLLSSGQYFKIPEGTTIAPGGAVKFPKEITKLSSILVSKSVELVYPDGTRALVGRLEKQETDSEEIEEKIFDEVALSPVVKTDVPVSGVQKEKTESVPIRDEDEEIIVDQTAAVILSTPKSDESSLRWYVWLAALLVLVMVAIIGLQRGDGAQRRKKNL
tara:strand:- start:14308 stop:15630 length:1323 start_codon:yes stop_codon:yes gene_type:complete